LVGYSDAAPIHEAALGTLLTDDALFETGETFPRWLGWPTSIAEGRVFAMPLSLGVPSSGSNGVVGRSHDGLARLASLAPMRRANIVAKHNRPLAALTCAEGNDLAAAAMEMRLEAVASRAAWVVGLAIV
jgi:hypothetical protein